MMSEFLMEQLKKTFGDQVTHHYAYGEVTLTVLPADLFSVCQSLRDMPCFGFDMLVDICGVDYLTYGQSEWDTEDTTNTGFDRAVLRDAPLQVNPWPHPRFATVYHLSSLSCNQRLRVKVYLDADMPRVDSVIDIWPSANWFEREAFDLYGILFNGHPDLRRILTDYGFIGHPFRKDFPLSGHVEVRYDKASGRVIYAPVDIEPRVLVPKVIRDDNRYMADATHLTGEQEGKA